MRSILLASLLLAALTCRAQDASIEIGGLEIRRGMARADVAAGLEPPYQLGACSQYDLPDGAFEDCTISDGTDWERGGEITFHDGAVWNVTRNLRSAIDLDAYELLVLISELVDEATEQDYVCASLGTFHPQELFPQTETLLVLPDRIISIGTAARDKGHVSVFVRESLRINPVADDARVHKSRADAAQCVYADP